jgi:hypothetical protein
MLKRTFHLAQANIGWMRHGPDDPRMAEFVQALAPVNAEAERHPGFVWRLAGPGGDSLDLHAFDDPTVLLNVSVWRSLETLSDFTYRSGHLVYLRDRRKWFHPPERTPVVLWWVPARTRPDVRDAVSRFESLWANGPSPRAFTFRTLFSPDGTAIETERPAAAIGRARRDRQEAGRPATAD